VERVSQLTITKEDAVLKKTVSILILACLALSSLSCAAKEEASSIPPQAASSSTAPESSTPPGSLSDVNPDSNNIFVKIMNGDLSDVVVDEWGKDIFKTNSDKEDDYEWIEYDINRDGTDELIYQFKNYPNNIVKAIVGMFAVNGEKAKLVLFDIFEMPRFYFLSKNGNIIYSDFWYGTTDYDSYWLCEFDKEWNIEVVYKLELHYIYDLSELPSDWKEIHPNMNDIGVYYSICYVNQDQEDYVEDLDEEEFYKLFEEMTGFSFDEMKPDWYDMAQKG
jgi:hypothetical protein